MKRAGGKNKSAGANERKRNYEMDQAEEDS